MCLKVPDQVTALHSIARTSGSRMTFFFPNRLLREAAVRLNDELNGLCEVGAGLFECAGLCVSAWQLLNNSDIALADLLQDSGEFHVGPRTRSARKRKYSRA
jgi:hypothetical protein